MNTKECFDHANALRKEGKLDECRAFMDEKVSSKEMLTSDRTVILGYIARDAAAVASNVTP